MQNVLIILRKEWFEIRQQRLLLFTVLLPPVILTILPLFTIWQAGTTGTALIHGVPTNLNNPLYAGMSAQETAQASLGTSMSILYLLIPGLITSVIAAYSIIGEKTGRTLEPLLATPVRTWELLVGKCLAALLPGIGATWLGGIVFIVGMSRLVDQHVFSLVVSPGWLVLFLVWAPLLAIIAVAAMIAISSRVNDTRTAQQLSGWLVIPFLLVFTIQLAGVQVLGVASTLIVAVALAILAGLAVWGLTLIFQREVILTRWK